MAEETWEMSCTGHTQSAAAGDDDNEGKKMPVILDCALTKSEPQMGSCFYLAPRAPERTLLKSNHYRFLKPAEADICNLAVLPCWHFHCKQFGTLVLNLCELGNESNNETRGWLFDVIHRVFFRRKLNVGYAYSCLCCCIRRL